MICKDHADDIVAERKPGANGPSFASDAATGAVAPQLIHGDVTRLDDLGVGDAYTLLLDFGRFHTLPSDRRPAYVTGVSHAAAPGGRRF